MKKQLLLSIFVIILTMSACVPGGYKETQASASSDNLECSFVLDSSVGYDIAYGVGFSGVIYRNDRTETQTLWVPRAIYDKISCVKDTQIVKIFKGKCFYCKGQSRLSLSNNAYFVYYVE